jgi:uncharacterized membrane protein YcaP (DUF421 family)
MGNIVRGTIAYLCLLFVIRVTSRRAAGPGTPFELILIFLFGGMTVQSVVSDDRSLTGALIGVITVAWLHTTVARLKLRFPAFGLVIDGTPVVLVEDGYWFRDRLRRLRLSEQDVMADARGSAVTHSRHIRDAVFERNGSISVFAWPDDDGGA